MHLRETLVKLGYSELNHDLFDTLHIQIPSGMSVDDLRRIALRKEINLRYFSDATVGISIDETTGTGDVNTIIEVIFRSSG